MDRLRRSPGRRSQKDWSDRRRRRSSCIDSWSARATWRQGPWQAQFSGGRLKEPEWFDPYDATRLTASIGFNGTVASRPLAATLAWGENRELLTGPLDGYLLEWDLRVAKRWSIYGRGESMRKEVLSLGVHPRGLRPASTRTPCRISPR